MLSLFKQSFKNFVSLYRLHRLKQLRVFSKQKSNRSTKLISYISRVNYRILPQLDNSPPFKNTLSLFSTWILEKRYQTWSELEWLDSGMKKRKMHFNSYFYLVTINMIKNLSYLLKVNYWKYKDLKRVF